MKDSILNDETQVKDKPIKVVTRIIVLALVFVFLIISYVFAFNTSLYPSVYPYKIDGTFSAENYYDARNLDLIIIKPTSNVSDIKVGDIMCFATVSKRGSGMVTGFGQGVIIVELKNGTSQRVSIENLVGKQVRTIPVLGLIVYIFTSYVGVIVFTLLALAICLYITFSRINYENTSKGKELLRRYRKDVREEKQRKILINNIKRSGDIHFDIEQILSGDFEHNSSELDGLNYLLKGNKKEKYKYLLSNVYDAYIFTEELNSHEKELITNVIELMCEPNSFDLDMEYRLKDLALKVKLQNFDEVGFKQSALSFFTCCNEEEDLLCFINVLYILLRQNPKLRDDEFKSIIESFMEKAGTFTEENQKIAVLVAKEALNLIKS